MYYFILFLILLLFLFLNRKNKRNYIYIPFIAILIIIMGGNTDNPDSIIYYNIYNNGSLFTKDILFGYLVEFSNSIGLTLNEFRMIIASFGLVLIYSTLFKYSKKFWLFTLLYFLFPFIYDVIQVRNFLGCSIVIFSIPFIAARSKTKNIIGYVFIVLASLIQKTHFIWFLLIYIGKRFENINKSVRNIIIVIIIIISILFLNPSINNWFGNILASFDVEGMTNYTNRITNLGWLIYWIIHFINIYILYYCRKRMKENNEKNNDTKNSLKLIYNINLSATILLPFYIINPTYSRFIRNIMILDFIYISYYYCNMIFKTKDEKIVNIFVSIIYSIFIFILTVSLTSYGSEGLFVNLFNNNWLFS